MKFPQPKALFLISTQGIFNFFLFWGVLKSFFFIIIIIFFFKGAPPLKNQKKWSNQFKDFLGRCLKKNPTERAKAIDLLQVYSNSKSETTFFFKKSKKSINSFGVYVIKQNSRLSSKNQNPFKSQKVSQVNVRWCEKEKKWRKE